MPPNHKLEALKLCSVDRDTGRALKPAREHHDGDGQRKRNGGLDSTLIPSRFTTYGG